MEYRHVQWGWFALPTLAIFAVVLGFMLAGRGDELSTGVIAATAGFMAAILLVVLHFSRMEVTVSGDRATASFGSGWPRRVIDLDDVTAVRQVQNSWWYGWGIRKVPKGWMYNTWGYDAVELDLGSGGVFRIGTDEPETLAGVLTVLRGS